MSKLGDTAAAFVGELKHRDPMMIPPPLDFYNSITYFMRGIELAFTHPEYAMAFYRDLEAHREPRLSHGGGPGDGLIDDLVREHPIEVPA